MNDRPQQKGLEPNIRNAVRAVIVRDHAVLMQKKWAQQRGTWYTLPGGGQDVHETLVQALVRECEEEIGATVEIESLLAIADFYKQRDTVYPSVRHLVEFLFGCSLPASYQPASGHHPDKHQVDVVWVPFADILNHEIFPKGLAPHLPGLAQATTPTYLGVID
ncbi:MAG: NUDIX domain-containing protein [Candidatus Thiodiazotropha sp. (ex Cardiolucina cf. quadrata)]|nr:NUDIX domain-containing protein [Candidatus Thiodiazotropha sp. (ex Cardiolucina cf. quadrata)]